MYKPRHFVLQEWLPENYYEHQYPIYGARLWQVFDYRILITMDRLRDRYGVPFVMNTWFSDKMIRKYGRHEWRGFRDYTSPYVQKKESIFGNVSQHRFGRAADSVPLGVPVEAIRNDIRTQRNLPAFVYITCIEEGVSWLHVDVRNHDVSENGLLIVRP